MSKLSFYGMKKYSRELFVLCLIALLLSLIVVPSFSHPRSSSSVGDRDVSRRGRVERGPAARGADHEHRDYLTVQSHDQEKHQGFHILDATITGAKISDATISAAKFTGTIESDNYSAGSAGWQIDRENGDAEFNNVTIRGRFETGTTGNRVVIPDGSYEIFLYTGDADEVNPGSIAPVIDGSGGAKRMRLSLESGTASLTSSAEILLISKSKDGTTHPDTVIEMSSNRVQVNGDFHHIGSELAFFNGTRTTKQTVSGSRGGNAALADLLTVLQSYGLITDSTTS